MWLFEPLDFDPADADAEAPPMDHGVGGWKSSQFSVAAARIVLARATRGDTIDAILAAPNMPCRRTLYDWIRDIPPFRDAWQAMRDAQALRRQRDVEDAELFRAILEAHDAEVQGRKPRAKRGRKSTYTRAAAEAWCDLIARGATLREAAAEPGMPAVPMVYRWLRNHPEFRGMYIRAAEIRDTLLQEQAIDLANSLGYSARRTVDAIMARCAALKPDVWR